LRVGGSADQRVEHRPTHAICDAALGPYRSSEQAPADELWDSLGPEMLCPAIENGRLRMERALKVWRQGTPEFGPTKTDKPRTVELAPQILELLTTHIAAVPHPTPDSLVFTNTAGGPIHQVSWLRNHFKPAVARALPDHPTLRLHDLRHTFISLLIAQGVNVKAIAAQAGHASAAMTLDRYAHIYPADDAKVKNALSAAYASATRPADSNVIDLHPTAASTA
jgi:hypothetical protein